MSPWVELLMLIKISLFLRLGWTRSIFAFKKNTHWDLQSNNWHLTYVTDSYSISLMLYIYQHAGNSRRHHRMLIYAALFQSLSEGNWLPRLINFIGSLPSSLILCLSNVSWLRWELQGIELLKWVMIYTLVGGKSVIKILCRMVIQLWTWGFLNSLVV